MLERFEGTDGLAAIFPAMLNSLIALKALGYTEDHPQVLRAEKELKKLEHESEHSVRIEPCFSPVWDTAIVGVCLAESGISSEHPAMKKATEWLINKEIRFRGDWQYKIQPKWNRAGGCLNSRINGTRTWMIRRWCCWRSAKCPRTIRESATNVSSAA